MGRAVCPWRRWQIMSLCIADDISMTSCTGPPQTEVHSPGCRPVTPGRRPLPDLTTLIPSKINIWDTLKNKIVYKAYRNVNDTCSRSVPARIIVFFLSRVNKNILPYPRPIQWKLLYISSITIIIQATSLYEWHLYTEWVTPKHPIPCPQSLLKNCYRLTLISCPTTKRHVYACRCYICTVFYLSDLGYTLNVL